MKFRYQLILLFAVIIACNNKDRPKQIINSNSVKKDSANGKLDDSLYKIKMLAFALAYANKNKDKDSFLYKSEQLTIDSGSISMDYGCLFDKQHKHLIIRIPPIDTPYVHLTDPISIYLYVLKENRFVLLCSQTVDNLGGLDIMGAYQGDTLRDINGDGYKDFVVNWYSGNGCCPRAENHIFFYNSDNGTVTSEFDLMNATFLSDKKIVYLMDYGFPGKIAMYKCEWRGIKLDTIESVSANSSHRNMFDIENEATGKIKTVRGLPKEYRCIDKSELDWFLSAWEK